MALSDYQHTTAERFMRYVQVDTQSDPASLHRNLLPKSRKT